MSPHANVTAPALMRVRSMRILLAEQDAELASALRGELERIGFQVDWVTNGCSAEHMLTNESFDAILLGWELPYRSGAELLADLRAIGNAAPVLVIAARDTLEERVASFNGGADDFLSRPVPVAELIARVNAVLRRSPAREDRCLRCGPLVYNRDTLLFHLDGVHLALTPREHAVLVALVEKAGAPVSRAALLQRMPTHDAQPSQSGLEIVVHRLRKKLGRGCVAVETVREVGYRLVRPS